MIAVGPLPTIFISIASYRDPGKPSRISSHLTAHSTGCSETQWTIRSALDRAKYPERITFGICWQYNFTDDKEILFNAIPEELFPGQIRAMHIPYTDAAGPGYARHLIQTRLFSNENYVLQIDSHTRFRQDFDVDLTDQLERARLSSPMPILSTYPPGYNTLGQGGQAEADAIFDSSPDPTVLLPSRFDDDSFLRIIGRSVPKTHGQQPLPNRFWAAGFSFSDGSVVHDCPYDPHLSGIFFGEESVMAVRLFTSGYDFFSPAVVVCLTKWSRSYRSVFREVSSDLNRSRAARLRLMHLLGCLNSCTLENENRAQVLFEIDLYGLGSVRTLEQFEKESGVQFHSRSIGNSKLQIGLPADANSLISAFL